MGCSAFGEFSEFECSGGLAVGGCTLGPQCLVSINTDGCAPLVQNQDPVEGCDCYDYW